MRNRTHARQAIDLLRTGGRDPKATVKRAIGTSTDATEAAAIQTAIIETDAVSRGGMVSTTGSGGVDTSEVDDRLDDLVRRGGDVAPTDRPSLDDLVDRFGLLPFERAVTSHDTSPHRYTWFALEVEKGAQHAAFTLSHAAPAVYWMYLVDPAGNEVRPTSTDVVAWTTGSGTYEIAAVARPAPGQWLVVAVRLDRGPVVPSKAIAAIDHRQVAVFGEAFRHGVGSPVEFRAGASFVEPLTDLVVAARVRRPGGPWHDLQLDDDALDGHYRARADLLDGHYSGYFEIRAPERPRIAGERHGMMHADEDGNGAARAETAGFLRHVPISVAVGSVDRPSGSAADHDEQVKRVAPDHDPHRLVDRRRRTDHRRGSDAAFESPIASMR